MFKLSVPLEFSKMVKHAYLAIPLSTVVPVLTVRKIVLPQYEKQKLFDIHRRTHCCDKDDIWTFCQQ